MCSIKIIPILLIIIIIVTYRLLLKEDEKCHENNCAVDITNGDINIITKDIIHNKVRYTEKDYFVNRKNQSQILGCLCNIEKFIRKCCPVGKSFSTEHNVCVDSDRELLLKFHNKKEEIKVPERNPFKFVFAKNCTYGAYILQPEFYDEDEYYLQLNGSLYLPQNEPFFYKNPEDYCLDLDDSSKNTNIALACVPPSTSESAFIIGIIISILFLVVTIFVYACNPELQDVFGKCLMCHASIYLIKYICLVVVQYYEDGFCSVAVFIIYFASNAAFLWLHVMCIEIWWTLRHRNKFIAFECERTRFLVYSLYAWGIPLVMLCITITLYFAPNLPDYIVEENCWFSDNKSSNMYFNVPILGMLVVNFTSLVYTSIEMNQIQIENKIKQRYKQYLKLFVVFCINWILEIVAGFLYGPIWMWYAIDVMNGLYGACIFLIFVDNRNAWKRYRKWYDTLMGKPHIDETPYPSTFPTQSTITLNDIKVSTPKTNEKLSTENKKNKS